MSEPAFCPYDHVTRRWTGLAADVRDHHARRLTGVPRPARLRAPSHFAAVIAAALDGDLVAFAWLADELRPALLVVGRRLRYTDDEWGSVALEALHLGLRDTEGVAPRWQRRRLHQRVTQFMQRTVAAERRRERLHETRPLRRPESDPDPINELVHRLSTLELGEELARLLDTVEPDVAAGMHAVAEGVPLADVAAAHGMTHAQLRQRMSRSRPRLRRELADWNGR